MPALIPARPAFNLLARSITLILSQFQDFRNPMCNLDTYTNDSDLQRPNVVYMMIWIKFQP